MADQEAWNSRYPGRSGSVRKWPRPAAAAPAECPDGAWSEGSEAVRSVDRRKWATPGNVVRSPLATPEAYTDSWATGRASAYGRRAAAGPVRRGWLGRARELAVCADTGSILRSRTACWTVTTPQCW